jgi:hypothetical protein
VVQIAVALKNGEWTVFRDGAAAASAGSRSEAVRLAEALAFQAESQGEAVELLVQDYAGELRARYSGGA